MSRSVSRTCGVIGSITDSPQKSEAIGSGADVEIDEVAKGTVEDGADTDDDTGTARETLEIEN